MTRFRRTYRDVDGQRVDGIWRHISIRNMDTYFLTDLYTDLDSPYWVAGQQGTNWIGQLLEVIRSELAAAAAGIPVTAPHDGGSSATP